jgi:hypothetical protein
VPPRHSAVGRSSNRGALPVPFAPKDLRPHLRLPPEDALVGYEAYSREALAEAAPESEKESYMAAADEWVIEHEGHWFDYGPDAAPRLYLIPPERVPL